MKLFILLVCLLVMATQARPRFPFSKGTLPHLPPGNHKEHGHHEHWHGPQNPPGFGLPPTPTNFTATDRLAIPTELFPLANKFILMCFADADNAPKMCWIVRMLVRQCENAPQEQPYKSLCDIFSAVKDEEYTTAEEIIIQVYGGIEAYLDEKMPAYYAMEIKNRMHQGMEMMFGAYGRIGAYLEKMPAYYATEIRMLVRQCENAPEEEPYKSFCDIFNAVKDGEYTTAEEIIIQAYGTIEAYLEKMPAYYAMELKNRMHQGMEMMHDAYVRMEAHLNKMPAYYATWMRMQVKQCENAPQEQPYKSFCDIFNAVKDGNYTTTKEIITQAYGGIEAYLDEKMPAYYAMWIKNGMNRGMEMMLHSYGRIGAFLQKMPAYYAMWMKNGMHQGMQMMGYLKGLVQDMMHHGMQMMFDHAKGEEGEMGSGELDLEEAEAADRLAIRTEIFQLASKTISMCSADADNAPKMCWIVRMQVKQCENASQEQPYKSFCDIFNAVKDGEYITAEEIIKQAYGGMEAYLDEKMPAYYAMWIKNRMNGGMEMMLDSYGRIEAYLEKMPAYYAMWMKNGMHQGMKMMGYLKGLVQNMMHHSMQMMFDQAKGSAGEMGSGELELEEAEAADQLAIRTEIFQLASKTISMCSTDADNAPKMCWIVRMQVKQCENAPQEQPYKSFCDMFNAVKDGNYTTAEEIITQAYGGIEAYLDEKMPAYYAMEIKNGMNRGMEMMLHSYGRMEAYLEKMPAYYAMWMKNGMHQGIKMMGYLKGLVQNMMHHGMQMMSDHAKGEEGEMGSGELELEEAEAADQLAIRTEIFQLANKFMSMCSADADNAPKMCWIVRIQDIFNAVKDGEYTTAEDAYGRMEAYLDEKMPAYYAMWIKNRMHQGMEMMLDHAKGAEGEMESGEEELNEAEEAWDSMTTTFPHMEKPI